jgi:hypothetical protein
MRTTLANSLDCAVVCSAVVAELDALADVDDAPELLLARHTLQLGVAEAPAAAHMHVNTAAHTHNCQQALLQDGSQ